MRAIYGTRSLFGIGICLFFKAKTLEGFVDLQHRCLHRRRASLRNVDAHEAIARLRPLPGPEKRIDARPGRTFVIEQNAIVRAKARSSRDN